MKTCPCCKQNKSKEYFYIIKNNLSFYCIDCKKLKDRQYYKLKRGKDLKEKRQKNLLEFRKKEKEWRNKNPDRSKGKLLKKYWPECTWQQALQNFNLLLEKQNNTCAICKKPEKCIYNKNPNIIRDLCVDHDHSTGKVRGLLCDDCNVLLGRAKDNSETCYSAFIYLKEHKNAAL